MLRKPNMLLFARFTFTAHLGLSASTSMEFKLRNPSFEFWSHQTPASSHPPPQNSSFGIQAPSKPAPAFIKPPASSHPPPRNPSIEFWSYQSFTPVRRIRLQEIQASHFGHFNPPTTSNRRRSMRLQSHHLRVIHICCERWSRMRAHAHTD